MHINILLAVYNGENYLDRLIDSLENQCLPLDSTLEILVVDDCSSDGSPHIIRKWQSNSSHVVKLKVNKSNCGWKNSFKNLLNISNGDLIFFADQDDIWHKEKIKTVANFVESHGLSMNDPYSISHHANVIDSNGEVIQRDVFLGAYSFEEYIVNIRKINGGIYGCCLGVSNALCNIIKKQPENPLGHDHLACLVNHYSNGVFYNIELPLIDWRLHDNNSSRKKSFSARLNQLLDIYNNARFESKLFAVYFVKILAGKIIRIVSVKYNGINKLFKGWVFPLSK